jgi:putative Holliday junction resolvase
LDYGTKRVGIAVTDPMQIIATALETVHPNELLAFLTRYMQNESVECIVIGDPKRLNNEPAQASAGADQLAEKLRKAFPTLKIDRMDERFTSKMAFAAMLEGGLSKKQRADKATVDKVSATIILQSYMASKE